MSKIGLVTKRKDVKYLCEALLPSCRFDVFFKLEEVKEAGSNILIEASIFEDVYQIEKFASQFSSSQMVFLIVTEVKDSVLSYINKNFDLVFRFPSDVELLKKNLSAAIDNTPQRNVFLDNEKTCTPIYGYFSGVSPAITKVREQMKIAAMVDTPILLLGETGTGKTTAAKLIYLMSPRNQQKFYLRSLPSIAESLMESELFGIKKGACTGVDNTRDGIMMSAQGGVLFLDEIGTATIKQQKILLPILDSGTFNKVGSNEKEILDIRWIFGTNINIKDNLRNGTFSPDLYYRINTNTIEIPALRNRKEDIPYITERYLLKSNKDISKHAIEKLMNYDWPGNVRQLNTCLENAKNKSRGKFIFDEDIFIEEYS